MEKKASFCELALEGVERMRKKDFALRGRLSSLLLLLRGAYYTGEGKWRAMAEEDLRALWRSGAHDHIGGGFFSQSLDCEWLRPSFEKRLDDNAAAAFLYAEAWESGRMGFYRDAAEEALDFCLRELAVSGGLYGALVRAADPDEAETNPFLFTPEQVCAVLGDEDGRHFAECYDITGEGNCGGGSIPNLLLNERWRLVPPGYDDLREKLRAAREAREGLVTEPAVVTAWNALLLAALAKAGRVFEDRRYLAAAEELAERLLTSAERRSHASRAALAFALTELYAADYDPAHIAAAAELAETLRDPASWSGDGLSVEGDRTLKLAALAFDALWRLTEDGNWRGRCAEVLLELAENPSRHGPESLAALCVPLAADRAERKLLCVTPFPQAPEMLSTVRSRYAPDLRVLLKTPQNAAALGAAAPWTEAFGLADRPRFYPAADGVRGEAFEL